MKHKSGHDVQFWKNDEIAESTNMSNQSKRHRTNFTRSQYWERLTLKQRLMNQYIVMLYDNAVSEWFTKGFTESTGSEDVKR